jgi:hypothetical protein
MDQKDVVKKNQPNPQKPPEASSAGQPSPAVEPLEEILGRAEKAYTAYIDAQKEVGRAYKRNEVQFDRSFAASGEKANASCTEAIQKAARDREMAEKAAEEAMRKAVEQAKTAYEATVQQALKARDEAVSNAWNARKQAIDSAWKVFGKD